jgi:hypothetical protein
MTWIEATCPTCGTVECSPEDFELAVCDRPEHSYYCFACPVCLETIQKHAEERVVELLVAEGVTPTTWMLPGELLESHDGPPLTHDDLLELHLALERPDWFEELTSAA